jgi:hypothetical protein
MVGEHRDDRAVEQSRLAFSQRSTTPACSSTMRMQLSTGSPPLWAQGAGALKG